MCLKTFESCEGVGPLIKCFRSSGENNYEVGVSQTPVRGLEMFAAAGFGIPSPVVTYRLSPAPAIGSRYVTQKSVRHGNSWSHR